MEVYGWEARRRALLYKVAAFFFICTLSALIFGDSPMVVQLTSSVCMASFQAIDERLMPPMELRPEYIVYDLEAGREPCVGG